MFSCLLLVPKKGFSIWENYVREGEFPFPVGIFIKKMELEFYGSSNKGHINKKFFYKA